MSETLNHQRIPPFPRDKLVQQVFKALTNTGEVLLKSPALYGKTAFVREILVKHPTVCEQFTYPIFLDLYALRISDPVFLEREIVRWLCHCDERRFMALLRKFSHENSIFPFRSYLNKKKNEGRVALFVTHLDTLPLTDPIKRWLTDFRRFLKDSDIPVLWSKRVTSIKESCLVRLDDNQQDIAVLDMPLLSEKEIGDWLTGPVLGDFAQQPSIFKYAWEATGGLPTLVRDLVRYMMPHHLQIGEYRFDDLLLTVKKQSS